MPGYRLRANSRSICLGWCAGEPSSAIQGTEPNQSSSPEQGKCGNYTKPFPKEPPILTTRPKCTQLTPLLHQMTMFGMSGLTFHWTCHLPPPPHRQSTPHWFLMAVSWRGAQLKKRGNVYLDSLNKKLKHLSSLKKNWNMEKDPIDSSILSGLVCDYLC